MKWQIVLCRIVFSVAMTWSSVAHGQLLPNLGGQRTGITVAQFLKIGTGARAVAMSEAFVALANDVSCLHWNPAGAVQLTQNEFMFSHGWWVIDIQHEFFGSVYRVSSDDAVGLSVISLHTPDMEITTETQPYGTGRFFRYGDLAVGITYARKMTDQFSFGATIRYINETLDILKMRGVLIDLGTLYWTGLGSARFGVVITNFGPNLEPSGEVVALDGAKVQEFQSFSPPTLFKVGVAFEPYEQDSHRITTSVQLNHPNDNAEHLRLGFEYEWNQMLAFRAGIKRTIGESILGSDRTGEEDVSLGLGVATHLDPARIRVDYAFTNFNRLGTVHRMSISVGW